MTPQSLALLLLASFIPLSATAEVTLQAITDRPEALYQTGETATFTITATDEGQPLAEGELRVTFSKDGILPQPPRIVAIKEGKAVVSEKLDEPGFLSMKARMQKNEVLAAAGFSVEEIKPSMPPPADFDTFWHGRKEKLAAVPMNARLTPQPELAGDAPMEVFDVQLDSVGASPVSGYYTRPKNAVKGSLPAILTLHGAGVRSAGVDKKWNEMEGGMLSFNINAHGLPNGKPEQFYKDLSEGELKNYNQRGRYNREEIYFLGMFERVLRAIDFLAAQPEWDGKTLILYGSSQGGYQALAGAGLDSRVSFFCAGVPAGCDHTGFAAQRVSGWPKLVAMTPDARPDMTSTEAARYFDAVNFATRTKARGAAFTVGLIDTVCPPTSVYAAYNALPVPKAMHIDPLAGHTNTPAAYAFMEEAVRAHIREMKKAD